MASINDQENQCAYISQYIADLDNIPNTFNPGQCTLQIGLEACPLENSPIRFPDAWHFLEKKFLQKNLNPDDYVIPKYWKLNLMTRVYVELKKFEDAKRLNEKAIKKSRSCNIVALANYAVLLRCFGRKKEASDIANELNEKQKSMSPQFQEQMIDAISEQAYYHYMFSTYNAYTGTVILKFVKFLRPNELKDHEKYLLFRTYRRLAHPKNKERDKAEVSEIVQLLHDIENGENDLLKALTYIEMGNPSFDIEMFNGNGETRSKDTFIDLALTLGEKNALVLYLIGLQKLESNNLDMAKDLLRRSCDIEPSERACHYLGHLYLQEAQSLSQTEENNLVVAQNELYQHETDKLRQYLLRYRDYLDWTKNSQTREQILNALEFFRLRNELLAIKTMNSMFDLALLYVKWKKYSEAIKVIDSHVLSSQSLDKNALIEIQVCVLKAIAVESQHGGPEIIEESKELLIKAVQKSYLKTDDEMATMSDDTLLINVQKIPTFKALRASRISGRNDNEKIRNFLSIFMPTTESDKTRQFKPEFLEITCIRNACFLIENNNCLKANDVCMKIISDAIPNNIFSKVQALILTAKALERPLPNDSNRELNEDSKDSIEQALSLIFHKNKEQKPFKKKLFKDLKHIYLKYSYFF